MPILISQLLHPGLVIIINSSRPWALIWISTTLYMQASFFLAATFLHLGCFG